MQSKTYLPKMLGWSLAFSWLISIPMISLGCPVFEGNSFYHWWMVDAGPNQNICLGESAQLTATGANAYTWTPASGLSCTDCPDPEATPLVTTTYFVMGDDGTTDSVVVSVFDEPEIIAVTSGDPTDCSLQNGTIVIEAEGAGPLEFSVDGGNIWYPTGFFTALPSGFYNTAVRNVGGACQISGPSVSLVAPSAPEILNISETDPTFCDNPNGAIIISSTGGIPPLSYSIDGGMSWQNTNTFQLLSSGNYDVRVRNADGSCEISGGIISLSGSPDEPIIAGVSSFGPSGCNTSEGIITVIVSNDTGNFEYSIDGGATYQASNSFNNLPEGVYEIIVRRNDGTCSVSGGFVDLLSPNRPFYLGNSVIQPSGCGTNDGNITILAFGSSLLEYSINGGIDWQATNIFTGLSAGFYDVSVRNINGTCQTPGNPVDLTEPSAPEILTVNSSDPTGCGIANGSIVIEATGAGTLEYSVDGGNTFVANPTFSNLGEGSYTIIVRESSAGCETVYVNNPVQLVSGGSSPVIFNVNISDPTTCGALDGTIFINATGAGNLEYSIDGGNNYSTDPAFFNLPGGNYTIQVRDAGGGCETVFQNNPVQLLDLGDPPVIDNIGLTQPSTCGMADGAIIIEATATGSLEYSIDNGANFQPSNTFTGLSAGAYTVVVALPGNQCSVSSPVSLANLNNCTDTVSVNIPANLINTICLDPSVFDFQGFFTGVGFCGQGNAATVAATSIAGECVTVEPAQGFTGTSPDLICTVHCFNNDPNQCDTTYIQVTVDVTCDPIFPIDTVEVPFIENPMGYCVPIPLASIPGYDLTFQGVPLNTTFVCDLDQTVAYSYGFLPGGGFEGPYSLDSWVVDGITYTGTFNDPTELTNLMNDINPAGFWQINAQGSIIFGGNFGTQYGNMEITQNSSGIPTVLMTNFTFQPQGFTILLTNPGEHILIATNPTTGCADTLVINATFDQPASQTVTLTTNVNSPTDPYCLDGFELPNGIIETIGFCENPMFGGAPLTNDSCVTYVPNFGFAGQDEFCVVVCDSGFPQICDTTFFIVNVLPEQDTVVLDIPAGTAGVDSCLSNFVIELPGPIMDAGFCDLNLNELNGTVNGNCVSFSPVNNFSGTSEVCVEFCSGGICDITIIMVNVAPPIICDELFADDLITIASPIDQGFICIPVPPSQIVDYQATIDGVPFIAFTPCDFGDVLFYNYNALPPGPYFLESWIVNGTTYMGNFPDILTLIDSMNVWDPSGNWINNPFGLTINGGTGGNSYGNLIISESGGGVFTISPDVVVLPLGSNMTIEGFGSHEVILTASNGCSDTATVILEQYIVTTENLFFETSLNNSVVPICANTDELLGSFSSFSICEVPSNGSITIIGDTCVSYTPNLNYSGLDNFCLVVCDDFVPMVCDTVFVTILTQLPIDTVFVDADDVVPFDECLDGSVLQLPGIIDTAFVCGSDPNEVTLSFAGNCVNIDLEDTFVGVTTACVVHCTADIPPICDTTYLVIEFDGVFPCDDFFNPDQVNVVLENDTGEVCLPVSVIDINDYTIFLDGDVYNGQLTGCDVDSVYTYFYSQVFGQGNAGPYDIEWTLNGIVQTANVTDMVALVNLMNGLDPAGNWVLDQSLLTISSTNDSGDYGLLQISHPSGSVAGLTANFNGMPNGTLVIFAGAGPHEVVLVDNFTNCDDTLFINGIASLDTIQVFTFEDTPTAQTCIDITGLPGNFVEMTICGAPDNGSLLLDNECFVYFPVSGFVGQDEACLEVCDDQGNCEIWIVEITVAPICSQFDVFPVPSIEIDAPDCSAPAAFCIPIELDSMANFGILDNGTPLFNFTSCNGDFTQVLLDTGFHEIIVVQLATQCSDTILVTVNCTPETGCGSSPLNGLSLIASDCDSTAEFCVDIAIGDLGNFMVTDNGNMPTQIGPCSSDDQFVGIALDTGFHEVILADTVKGCADTFLVNVSCFTVVNDTIDIEVVEGDSMELCLADYDFPVSFIDSLVNVCDDQSDGNATFSVDEITWCVTVFGEIIGQDTFCLKAYFADTCAILTVNVDVTDGCPDYIADNQILQSSSCATDSTLVCLPIDPGILTQLEIMVNGQPFTDTLVPCQFDSVLVFPYFNLPSAGIIGPYEVTDWSINGGLFTGEFNSAAELAVLMTLWDANGTWEVGTDDNGNTIISGGDLSSDYGTMTVEQTTFGNVVMLDIELQLTVLQLGINLANGTSTVTLTDTVTGCSETAAVDIICVENDTMMFEIDVDAADTFCLELGELLGNVVSVVNICEDLGGVNVDFEIDGECIIYTGLNPGTDTACIVVCDDLNICDTTVLIVEAQIMDVDTILIAVDDQVTTGEGQVIVIDVIQNDLFTNIVDYNIVDQPANGSAIFFPDLTINYVPNEGFCDDENPDVFTYEICNSLGCDTATVEVFVFCSDFEIFNAISPNGDGFNDSFRIRGLQNFPGNRLYIYNRWGNLVYEAVDYQSDWFGTWGGKDLPDGTYFYILDLGDGDKPLNGYVQIRR
ncbi:MAG: gliding motility-associated C-terminal domain-containing protein [Bacteroidota bacterium]